MRVAIPPLLQYAFTTWCSIKVQGQIYAYLYPYQFGYGLKGKITQFLRPRRDSRSCRLCRWESHLFNISGYSEDRAPVCLTVCSI